MIITNHYLVGVAGAVILQDPLFALPLALVSHFVMDMLPHFGLKYSARRGAILLKVSAVDAAVLLVSIALTAGHYPAWYILAGLVATVPDLAWVYRFTVREKFGTLPPPPSNKFNTWHVAIQKLESPLGALVEVLILVVLFGALFV